MLKYRFGVSPWGNAQVKMLKMLLVAAIAVGIAVAACGGSSSDPTQSTPAQSANQGTQPSTPPADTPVYGSETATPRGSATQGTAATSPTQTSITGVESNPVVITIASEASQVSSGDEVAVEVTVDPRGRGISGVQVLLRYDPVEISPLGVRPAGLLGPGPVEAGPTIDPAEGTVMYAAARVGITEPPTQPGLFATLKFLVLEGAPRGGEITITLEEVTLPDQDILAIEAVQLGQPVRLSVAQPEI